MGALSIDRVSIIYENGKTAVDDLSFEVREGEFFALLGPNGAGKTSLISAISGLIDYQKGQIRILEERAGSREAKRLLGLVPQELVSYGFFTVNEVLNFVAGYYGDRKPQKRIDELLARLQMIEQKNKLVSQLSGGMKRRMLIAKALLHRPKILLLDEPSAGVDVELRTTLWDFMRELNQQGLTILLTTHYLEEAQRLCERSAILHEGKVLALGKTTEIIQRSEEEDLERAFLKLIRSGASHVR